MMFAKHSIFLVLAFSMAVSAAKIEMTYEQYQTELSAVQQREKTAREEIAVEQSKIEALRQQINDLEQRISATQQEKYAILGITEADVIAIESELASIRDLLQILSSLSNEDLLKRKKDVASAEQRLGDVKKKPVSFLWRVRDQIAPLDQMLADLKSRLSSAVASPASSSTYRVEDNPTRRDCLYRIAEKSEVFGDPAQWPALYRANKGLLDRSYDRFVKKTGSSKYSAASDLLFPGQELVIPR